MDSKVFIADVYNRWIYPNDREAKSEQLCSRYVLSMVLMGYHDVWFMGIGRGGGGFWTHPSLWKI